MKARVILSGGGTGGHVYPLLAVAEAARDWQVEYAGTKGGLEAGIVRREGLPFHSLAAGGIRGKTAAVRVFGALRIASGVLAAIRLLRRLRPDAVLSSGGYAAAPVGFAALILRVPLVLLEPNASPGLGNRLMLSRADRILVAFEAAYASLPAAVRERAHVTGVPVRARLFAGDRDEARSAMEIPENAVVVAVFGGSRGATAINRAVRELARDLPENTYLLWATGERDWPDYQDVADSCLRIEPYFWDMPSVYAAADLMICRAGALTCAEITAMGLPSVLIPSPNVVADHQTENARVLSAAGAAVLLPEPDLAQGLLADLVRALVQDGPRRTAMGRAAAGLGRRDAALRAVQEVEQTVLRRHGSRAGGS